MQPVAQLWAADNNSNRSLVCEKPIVIFNGKDSTGWTHYLWDREANAQDTETPLSAVWTVENGMIVCQGKPTGYIRTNQEYENYKPTLERPLNDIGLSTGARFSTVLST